MVEKILVCPVCDYVPQNIPYEKQSRLCPVCKSPCVERDFVKGEDLKAITEDRIREAGEAGFHQLDKKKK